MYLEMNDSSLGCSVQELSNVWEVRSPKDLNEMKHDGALLAVTSDEYGNPVIVSSLKKAGFFKVVSYKNYAAGHEGNQCTLWAKIPKRCKPVYGRKPVKKKVKK